MSTTRIRRIGGENPLPAGTISIAIGLALAGITQYGFLAIAARALGPGPYAPLATFWSTLFATGPGVFMPMEQEVGRAVAARRARGLGGRPVVSRALLAGSGIVALLLVLLGALSPLVAGRLFSGQWVFVVALGLGFVAFLCYHTSRGTLSGNGRFGAYGVLVGAEGVLRVVLCVALALLGVKVGGLYGLAMVIATLIAIGIALRGQRGLVEPGPPAPWSELSTALGFLLVASVITQFLLSAGPIVLPLLETPDQAAAAGKFLNGRVIAYVPLYMFQAVQAALLPALARLAAAGHEAEFRRRLLRLLGLTAAFGIVSTAIAWLLGALAVRILFGSGFDLGSSDVALLTASCGGFMLAIVLNQALISISSYRAVTAGWICGGAAFTVVLLTLSPLFLRVEAALLAGSLAATAAMGVALALRLRRGLPPPHPDETVAQQLGEMVEG